MENTHHTINYARTKKTHLYTEMLHTRRGANCNQYWSPSEVVLVTLPTSTGNYH